MINIKLSNDNNTAVLQQCIASLSDDEQQKLSAQLGQSPLTALVDGRALACPMPLLKTKVAMRNMQVGESVYVIATDPNSERDLSAFCQQSSYPIVLSTHTSIDANNPNPQQNNAMFTLTNGRLIELDTIFHVIITKTHGN